MTPTEPTADEKQPIVEARVASARGGSTAVAKAQVIDGRTDRTQPVDDQYALATAWARSGDYSTHRGMLEFTSAIETANRVSDPVLTCFRGRPLDHDPAGPDEMGPPEAAKSSAQRYNAAGNPVLYLCDSELGVAREMAGRMKPGEKLWVQEFVISTAALNIINTTPDSGFLNHVFAEAERAMEATPASADLTIGWQFSQFVAERVSKRWDGMLVRGVRGDTGFHYSNLILFRPTDRWSTWLGKSAPKVISV